jgi:predicted PurR-regulated permease PerM
MLEKRGEAEESNRPSEPDGRAPLPKNRHARTTARTVFAVAVLLLAAWVALDFLTPIAWAVVIAVTIWPLYVRFRNRLGGDGTIWTPLIFTVLTAIIICVPLVLPLQKAAQESGRMTEWVTQLREQGMPPPGWLASLPLFGSQAAEWWNANLGNAQSAQEWLGRFNLDSVTSWSATLGAAALHRFFLFFIMLLALFFILRDGETIAARALDTADRVLGDPGERLVSKMVDAVRGTVTGTVVVAVVEGVVIGAAYVIAGVPAPFLLAFLTAAFAMLPFGAWVAFTVASFALLVQGGSGLAAAAVFGWGALVMFIGDHFVWPTLVGGAARLPFLLALIGIFGGLQVFGLLGLFLGPVIMATALIIWRDWLRPGEPAHTGS